MKTFTTLNIRKSLYYVDYTNMFMQCLGSSHRSTEDHSKQRKLETTYMSNNTELSQETMTQPLHNQPHY